MLYISFLKLVSAIVLSFTAPPAISKAQLTNLKCIYELSSELPTDIVVYNLSIVGKKEGLTIEYNNASKVNLADITPEGCDVKQEVRDFLKQIDIGKKVYFDFKYQRDGEIYPRAAVLGFIVTE